MMRDHQRYGNSRNRLLFFTILIVMNILLWWRQYNNNIELQEELEDYKIRLKDTRTIGSMIPFQYIEEEQHDPWNFFISMPVLRLDPYSRKIILPSEVKRLWFDVGAHKESMNCRPSLLEQDDLGLIAFEPMHDMWGQLNTINRHDRMMAIPAAVGLTDGWATFRRAVTDMCSSLKPVHPDAIRKDWPGGCTETKYEVKVPVVRLETILSLLPDDMNVEFLKIDAQGADFDVVASAGSLLKKINVIVVEVQVNRPLYDEAKTEEEYTQFFEKHGFELVKRQLQNKNEENVMYHNKRFPMPDESVLPLDKIFKDKPIRQ